MVFKDSCSGDHGDRGDEVGPRDRAPRLRGLQDRGGAGDRYRAGPQGAHLR